MWRWGLHGVNTEGYLLGAAKDQLALRHLSHSYRRRVDPTLDLQPVLEALAAHYGGGHTTSALVAALRHTG